MLNKLIKHIISNANNLRKASYIIIILVIIDQVSKSYLIHILPNTSNRIISLTSFLDIVYIWNYGISFGILRDYYQYSNMLFMILNSLIVLYLYYHITIINTLISFLGYSVIIGGALGNLIDRFFRGAVFDFICFYYKDIFFPIFNLADSFIFIGVLLVLFDNYFNKQLINKNVN